MILKEPFLLDIPKGDFSFIKTEEELEKFVEKVQDWVIDDEEQGNPFAYNMFRKLGNDITVQISGLRRIDAIYFRYKNKNFNPFFFFSILRDDANKLRVFYKAQHEQVEKISYENWNSHPNVVSIRNKMELKVKIKNI